MKQVLYIYGYGSSSDSSTARHIQECLGSDYQVHCIDYPQKNFKDSIKTLRKYCKTHSIDIVIGTSLGGYLTLFMTGYERYVVNPCMDPITEIKALGEILDFDSYKDASKHLVGDIEERHLVTGFFGDRDELLGLKYVPMFKKIYGDCIHIIPIHHRLQKDDISKYIVPVIQNNTKPDQLDRLMESTLY